MNTLLSQPDSLEMVKNKYPTVKWHEMFGKTNPKLVAQKTTQEKTILTLLNLAFPKGFSYITLELYPSFRFGDSISMIFDLYTSACGISTEEIVEILKLGAADKIANSQNTNSRIINSISGI
jgi:hypothetical protein